MLAAGRLVPQKDFALAISTLAHMARRRDVHLTIVGEGPERGMLAQLAARLGVESRLSMPGHLPSIIPALHEADVLLVTSRYEGGPAVAIEALEQGVPVIATDCSHFLHDLLGDDASGAIFATRDPKALAAAAHAWLDRSDRLTVPEPPNLTRFTTAAAGQSYLHLFDRCCLQ